MKGEVMHAAAPNMDNGIFRRLALKQRHKLLGAFQDFSRTGGSVLDIALEGGLTNPTMSGLFGLATCQIPHQVAMHTVRLADIPISSKHMTLGSFKLPFADGEFDWTCSNGVIEHMGNAERQFNLVREMSRVAKRGIFVATQSRQHPVNFSGAPRSQMLRAQDLYRMASLIPGKPIYDVGHKRVLGIKAYFFLMISKGLA